MPLQPLPNKNCELRGAGKKAWRGFAFCRRVPAKTRVSYSRARDADWKVHPANQRCKRQLADDLPALFLPSVATAFVPPTSEFHHAITAAVVREKSGAFAIEQLELNDPQPDEALV